MKRLIISTCTAMAFAVGLAAQTPPPAGQTPAAKPDQSAAAEKTVTLKGCLKAGDTPESFVLADAAPASETAGTAGTPSAMKQTVRLIGSPAGTNLKEHVGHMVEATGAITPGAKSSAPAAGAPPAGGAAPPAGASASDQPRLNVKSFKHLETKCS